MPESQNELLENAENTGGPEGAGDTALRYEAGFFGLKKLVKKSGVTAVEAATRILQVSSTLVSSYRVDDLANILSTAEELNAYKPVYHPLGIWLTRAREKGIEYRHSLDWAVKQYGSRTQKLGADARVETPDTSGAPQKYDPSVAKVDEAMSVAIHVPITQVVFNYDASTHHYGTTPAPAATVDEYEQAVGLAVAVPTTFGTSEKGEPAVTVPTLPETLKNRRASKVFVEALKKLLGEIELKVKEKSGNIDFKAMPGKCANLHELARKTKYFPKLTFATFKKYQKTSGLCSFPIHSADSSFYKELFPDLFK